MDFGLLKKVYSENHSLALEGEKSCNVSLQNFIFSSAKERKADADWDGLEVSKYSRNCHFCVNYSFNTFQ